MATSDRRYYDPTQVPLSVPVELRAYLDEELSLIALAINAVINEGAEALAPAAALFGAPGNMPISGTKTDVANWPNSASKDGDWVIDPVTGTITIPEDGMYRLVFWIYGNQGNDVKEESMRLGVRIEALPGGDTTDSYLDVFSVATDKTAERAFRGSLGRRFIAGNSVTLFMDATAGMGTFDFTGGTFELVKLFD